MGSMTMLECTSTCDWIGPMLWFGSGMRSAREVRRCAACGSFTDVLVQVGPDLRPASGRGRCRDCGSQALRRTPDLERLLEGEDVVVPCPRCAAPLCSQPAGIWD